MKSKNNLLGKLDRRATITILVVLAIVVIAVVACLAVFASEKHHKDDLTAQTEAALQQGRGSADTETAEQNTDAAAETDVVAESDASQATDAESVDETEDNTPEPEDTALTDSGAEDASQDAKPENTETEGTESGSDTLESGASADTNIIFTGDVMLSPYVLKNYDKGGIDSVVEPGLKDELINADILSINEEFPFGTGGTKETDKQYTFRIDPKYISVFTDMGVDAVGLANNHTLDYGKTCLTSTFDTLKGANIPYTGAGNSMDEGKTPVVIEKNGKSYAFIAASRVLPKTSWDLRNTQPAILGAYDTTQAVEAIQDAKSKYDYVFVMIHWGTEKTTKLTNYQQKMGHTFIDAGADAVIGSHPHVLQGIEYYNGKPVFYSLGNFIFNQTIKETAALKLTVSADGSLKYTLIPAKAVNGTTQKESDEEAAKTLESLRKISPGVNIDDSGVVTY